MKSIRASDIVFGRVIAYAVFYGLFAIHVLFFIKITLKLVATARNGFQIRILHTDKNIDFKGKDAIFWNVVKLNKFNGINFTD